VAIHSAPAFFWVMSICDGMTGKYYRKNVDYLSIILKIHYICDRILY